MVVVEGQLHAPTVRGGELNWIMDVTLVWVPSVASPVTPSLPFPLVAHKEQVEGESKASSRPGPDSKAHPFGSPVVQHLGPDPSSASRGQNG